MAGMMSGYAELDHLESSAWPAFLGARSGLPGPRANLPLTAAVAVRADAAVIEELLRDGGEYQVMCAAAAVARRSNDSAFETTARSLAADQRWRVREGVAIGLQLLGDTAPASLVPIVLDWADHPDPLVQRAAAAAICEPRLLRTPEAAATAIEVCRRTTGHLLELSAAQRRAPDARTLRQALGYCWSVAVAADPEAGLPVFRGLGTADPDLAWIVNQNSRKKRLSKLL